MERADAAQLSRVPEDQCRRMGEALRAAGYMPASVEDYPPFLEVRSREGANLPRLLYLTRDGQPLQILARLFLFGVPVEVGQAQRALAPVELHEWERSGLVRVDNGLVWARVCIYPFHGLALAVDPPELLELGAPGDFVSGVTNSTAALASFMVERPFPRVLDLGTGCGVLGLLAARRGGEVLATDVNVRALAFARFNARLNGIENIEFALGSAFEPAHGREFELILANPPCIIGPGGRYVFRDSGMELDGLCRRIVREAPKFLAEGGYFQSTAEWPVFEGVEWSARMVEWFSEAGCDGLVLRAATRTALDHAEDTVRHTESTGEQPPQLAAFCEYFESRKVTAISDGLIMMRRRNAGSNWLAFEELPPRKLEPFGEAALQFFEAQDRLASSSDEDLLGAPMWMAPGLMIESSREWLVDGWAPVAFTIRQSSGFRFFAEVDVNVANLIRLCDGSKTLSALLEEAAEEFGVEAEAIAPDYLPIVRHMISRGFLIAG